LDSESPGKVGSIKDIYESHNLQSGMDNAPQQIIQIDKSTFLVSEERKKGITLIECLEGANLDKCTSKWIKYKIDDDFVFQDAIIHESNEIIFLVWLNLDRSKIHIEAIDKDFTDENPRKFAKSYTANTGSQTLATFVNRLRIELIYEDTPSERRTTLVLFDQFIANGKDAPIDKKVSLINYYRFQGEREGVWGEFEAGNIPYEIKDDQNKLDLDSISTFYTHDDVIYVGSKRKDFNDGHRLCLTRLDFNNQIQKLTPSPLDPICGELSNSSYFGISGRNWIFEVNQEGSQIRMFDLNWPKQNKKYSQKIIKYYNFKSYIDGKRIRQIDEGEGNFSIHFANEKGISDSGSNTLTVFNKQKYEFRSAQNSVDITIDNFNYRVDQTKFHVTLIINPWYSLKSSLIKKGKSAVVKITAEDEDHGEGEGKFKPVTLESTFKSIEDPMSVITLNGRSHPSIHVGTNSVVKHGFEYADVLQGNSLTFDIQVLGKDGQPMTEGFTSAHESPISLRFRYWCRYRSEQ
jgi:hypothetical protein